AVRNTVAIQTAAACSPIETAILCGQQGTVRAAPIGVSVSLWIDGAESVQQSERAARRNLEHGAVIVGSAETCSAVEAAVAGLYQRRGRQSAIGIGGRIGAGTGKRMQGDGCAAGSGAEDSAGAIGPTLDCHAVEIPIATERQAGRLRMGATGRCRSE